MLTFIIFTVRKYVFVKSNYQYSEDKRKIRSLATLLAMLPAESEFPFNFASFGARPSN